jgi:predicted kinase
MTATLHFFCGKAGAGKSTLARQLATAQAAVLISEDVWLARLYGEEMATFDDYRARSLRLRTVIGSLVTDLLRNGQSVVLDFPANTRASRSWYRSLFEGADAHHVLHFVDTAERLCLDRIATRNTERPEGSHHLSEADFAHITSFFEPPQADEGFNIQLGEPTS